MSRQYLDVPYRSKDAAKALGARFDGTVKRWYVEAGTELSPFAAWLPAGHGLTRAVLPASSTGVAPISTLIPPPPSSASLSPFPSSLSSEATELATIRKGISLSILLNGVSQAVAQVFASGVWTLVEVNEASLRNGHVYLELSERDGSGQAVAKAKGVIWASTAARILPQFQKATGVEIGAGIKLLVRARPVFKGQYGFSLEIDAIDPEYTLGDLEARKREIRTRLQQEGLFDRNKKLPSPWDYRLVLVVAPQGAAGLGDFQKEAQRLEQHGICRFIYAHSRFQGEGAAGEIVAAALTALQAMSNTGQPDAVVSIRGGGAVNDLAWLNDYQLARFICEQPIPVLTGIGHERDNTLPDEVAHLWFDTPSKVIAGIEQHILHRSREARQAWETITTTIIRHCRHTRLEIERSQAQIRADAQTHLSFARHDSNAALNQMAARSARLVNDAASQSLAMLNQIRTDATSEIATARHRVPALMADIRIVVVK